MTIDGTWQNCEEIDFYLTAATGADGVTWIWLKCSDCGPVQATAQGAPSDLGALAVAAQGHLERKHVAGRDAGALLTGTPGRERRDGATVDLAQYDLDPEYRAMIDARAGRDTGAGTRHSMRCESNHAAGCECLEFGCSTGNREHACNCQPSDDTGAGTR